MEIANRYSIFWIILFSFLFTQNIMSTSLKLADGYFIPWSFYVSGSNEEKIQGISYEIGLLLAHELEMELEFYILPYARLFAMLEDGEIDMNISVDNATIQHSITTISPELTSVQFSIYSLKENPVNMQTLDGNTNIGIIRGTAGMWQPWCNENDLNINYIEINDFASMIGMLNSRRLDGIIVSEMSFLYENSLIGNNLNVYAAPLNMFKIPWSIRISKKSPLHNTAFLKKLSGIVERLKSEGQFEKIKYKYSLSQP